MITLLKQYGMASIPTPIIVFANVMIYPVFELIMILFYALFELSQLKYAI